jgi:hypothetical protein
VWAGQQAGRHTNFRKRKGYRQRYGETELAIKIPSKRWVDQLIQNMFKFLHIPFLDSVDS